MKELEEKIEATVKKIKAGTDKKVHVLRVDVSEGDVAVGYLTQPDRDVMGYFMANVESSPVRACETLLKSCLVEKESDPRLVEDDDIFYSTIAQINKIVALKKKQLEDLLASKTLHPNDDKDAIRKITALLHFHFKEDPGKWDDDKFSEKWAQLVWVRSQNKNETE